MHQQFADELDLAYYTFLAAFLYGKVEQQPRQAPDPEDSRTVMVVMHEQGIGYLQGWLWVNQVECGVGRLGNVMQLHFEGIRDAQACFYSVWQFFRDTILEIRMAQPTVGWDCVKVKKGTSHGKIKKGFGRFGFIYSIQSKTHFQLLRFDKIKSVLAIKEWRHRNENPKDEMEKLVQQSTLCIDQIQSFTPRQHHPLHQQENTAYHSEGLCSISSPTSQSSVAGFSTPHTKTSTTSLPKHLDSRCTLMLRNIPNCLDLSYLSKIINMEFRDQYDFLYLPMDSSTGCNLGYAFINLLDNATAYQFRMAFQGRRWEESGKIANVCFARIQGRDNLVQHFKRKRIF